MCTTDSSPQPRIDPRTAHQLDNPIWNSLTTVHAQIAEAANLACRFPADVTALGALMEPSREAWSALASLPSGPKVTVLVSDGPIHPTVGWEALESAVGLQMIYAERNPPMPAPTANSKELIELTATDAPEMLALAQLTRPGPFGIRARELGTFLGIRREGKLVAMAGERLRLPGFTEISAVCTHPQHTGQGLGAALVIASLERICGRGEVPFLHVREVNTRAIALYHRLGFARRRAFQFVAVRPIAA